MNRTFYPKPVCPMNQLRKLSLIAIVALLSIIKVAAQSADSVYLFVPSLTTGTQGQIVNIPIKVNQFKNLISAQFIVQWDSSRVKLLAIDNLGLPSMSLATHFAYQGENPDKLRFVWYETNLTPQNLPDNSTLFNLKMQLIGKKDEQTTLTFASDNLTSIEFLNKNSQEYKYGFNTGKILIDKSNSANEATIGGATVKKPFPNPFIDETFIKIENADNQKIMIEIYDNLGKKIYENNAVYEIGTNFVNINKNNIFNPGTYFYRISNQAGESISGKLIKLNQQ